METKQKLEEVIYVSWEESERGWGTRPDGCSLHLTEKDSKEFAKAYWSRMPDYVPDEYSRPAGRPVKAYVSGTLYKMIKESEKGIRLWNSQEKEEAKNKNLVYKKWTGNDGVELDVVRTMIIATGLMSGGKK